MLRLTSKHIAAGLAAAAFLSAAPDAEAQRLDTTGSRLGSTTTGRMITRFSDPPEVTRVLELLEAGEVEEALALAEAYLESLEGTIHTGGSSVVQERYLALNAYCVALTKSGRLGDAVAACTDAVGLMPRRWTAINNRGTAYFAMGRYDEAIADYREALEFAPNDDVAAAVRHNIGLAELRQSEADAGN